MATNHNTAPSFNNETGDTLPPVPTSTPSSLSDKSINFLLRTEKPPEEEPSPLHRESKDTDHMDDDDEDAEASGERKGSKTYFNRSFKGLFNRIVTKDTLTDNATTRPGFSAVSSETTSQVKDAKDTARSQAFAPEDEEPTTVEAPSTVAGGGANLPPNTPNATPNSPPSPPNPHNPNQANNANTTHGTGGGGNGNVPPAPPGNTGGNVPQPPRPPRQPAPALIPRPAILAAPSNRYRLPFAHNERHPEVWGPLLAVAVWLSDRSRSRKLRDRLEKTEKLLDKTRTEAQEDRLRSSVNERKNREAHAEQSQQLKRVEYVAAAPQVDRHKDVAVPQPPSSARIAEVPPASPVTNEKTASSKEFVPVPLASDLRSERQQQRREAEVRTKKEAERLRIMQERIEKESRSDEATKRDAPLERRYEARDQSSDFGGSQAIVPTGGAVSSNVASRGASSSSLASSHQQSTPQEAQDVYKQAVWGGIAIGAVVILLGIFAYIIL